MPHRPLILAALLLAPAAAQAATCEESFVKGGNPVTGLRFTATQSVSDMAPASAVGQLRGIVLGKGYAVLASEPESGAMLIEQPMTGKARSFPIQISATEQNGVGTVRMEAKLRNTMNISKEAAQTEMCGILAQLKGGKAGRALADKGNAAQQTHSAAPIRMSVLAFSSQMAGEAKRSDASLEPRHKGKAFTLFGPVGYVGKAGDRYRVDFKLLENALTSIVPGSGYRLEVSCVLASGQSAYALTLKEGHRVELTGIFDEYDLGRSTIYLRDCKPVR